MTKTTLAVLALLVPLAALPLASRARTRAAAPPMELRGVLTADGLRWYRLALPTGHERRAEPAPVVFLFHGGGGNALQAAGAYGVVEGALARGWVAVAPEGTGPFAPPVFQLETWNAGNCCGAALDEGVDDVAFFEALLAELVADENVDPQRVFLTGMSNGAMMSYRIAAERPDLVTAIAPVAGSLGVPYGPSEPVPLLAIHGLLDEHVPFEGGAGVGLSGTDFASQPESLLPFLAANGGTVPPPIELEQALAFASRDTYYYLALDGGHSWPGASKPAHDPLEPVHEALGATPLMFAFFELAGAR